MGCGAGKAATVEEDDDGSSPSPACASELFDSNRRPVHSILHNPESPSVPRKKSVTFQEEVHVCNYENGDRYRGTLEDEKRWGYGIFTWKNGDSYQGEWRDDEKHGTGVFRWAHGDEYSGEYFRGLREGHGTYVYATGEVYRGDWHLDKRHGRGIFTSSKGEYDGEWMTDRKHGHGTYRWSSGIEYHGEWRDDIMHGMGQLTFHGNKFTGAFAKGRKYGLGEMVFVDGKVFRGRYVNDLPTEGTLIVNNVEYVGSYTKATAEGSGVFRGVENGGTVWKEFFLAASGNSAAPKAADCTPDATPPLAGVSSPPSPQSPVFLHPRASM